jgi:folate-dependent phosphoribosylglycinamide formyltransferase PurN
MLKPSIRRIVVLCSGRAPGLGHLLRHADAAHRSRIVCCLTSEDAFESEDLVAREGLPIVHHSIRRFYAAHAADARLIDRQVRQAYDARTVELLHDYQPDLVLLAGYLWLLTAPMLTAFDGRIVNVYHADLLLRSASGLPRYPGLRAVRDAILAGERETRCTALRRVIWAHQEWMLRPAFGPLMERAIERLDTQERAA